MCRGRFFFCAAGVTATSSSSCFSALGSSVGWGVNGSLSIRWGMTSEAASARSSALVALRPSSAAIAFAHSSSAISARWLPTPMRTTSRAIAEYCSARTDTSARARLASSNVCLKGRFVVLVLAPEGSGIARELLTASHDLGPGRLVLERLDAHRQSEPVGDLRPQLTLLGIHRADQQKAGRMRDRDPLALDGVDPQSGRVEQEIDQVIVEEVDLVDVQQPPVGAWQAGPARRALAPSRSARARSIVPRPPGSRWRLAVEVDDGPAGGWWW